MMLIPDKDRELYAHADGREATPVTPSERVALRAAGYRPKAKQPKAAKAESKSPDSGSSEKGSSS